MKDPLPNKGKSMAGTAVKKKANGKKSGIKVLKPGETLFKQNDPANSLYIIQKGQLRLFLPKGRGFVELAILRAGEVIGEMAYFDEKSRRRSCSASAIVTTEIIEISFQAFHKTIQNLNPWFRTIITTLADRLRKTNDKVKELESNSVGFAVGGKVADYKFFQTTDVTKMLSLFYLVFKSHANKNEDGKFEIHLNRLRFYMFDIFNVPEVKFEEFFEMLKAEGFIEIGNDQDDLPKMIIVRDPEQFKSNLTFINSERLKEDHKKTRINERGLIFLKMIIDHFTQHPPGPVRDGNGKALMAYPGRELKDGEAVLDVGVVERKSEELGLGINDGDLADPINAGLCDDIVVGDLNKKISVVNYNKIKKLYPALKLLNAVDKINKRKSGNDRY